MATSYAFARVARQDMDNARMMIPQLVQAQKLSASRTRRSISAVDSLFITTASRQRACSEVRSAPIMRHTTAAGGSQRER
jgi:hypothetical protein